MPQNLLFKLTSLNGISVLLRTVFGLVLSKVMAIHLGPTGLGLLGNLRNFFTSLQALGTLGMYSGIVKYVAEHRDRRAELSSLLGSVIAMSSIATLGVSLILFYGAPFWSAYVMDAGDQYGVVFRALGLALPFYSANYLCLAVINGLSRYKKIIGITIGVSILGFVVSLVLITQYQLDGALWAFIVNPALSLGITLSVVFRHRAWWKSLPRRPISWFYLKGLGTFAVMTLLSSLLMPQVMIDIRNYLSTTIDAEAAGYWEAMQRLSGHYMTFVTSLFSLYLLPRLARTEVEGGFRKEVLHFYKTVLPLFALGCIVVYLLRPWIVRLVFSETFVPMESLFSGQLVGDFLKVASLALSYQFLAKKMFWEYVLTEITSIGITYWSSLCFIDYFGYTGVTIAHGFSYFWYFVLLLFVFRKELFVRTSDGASDRSPKSP